MDPKEGALDLSCHCPSDSLVYQSQTVEYKRTTMHNIYKVLTSQYDLLGYITHFKMQAFCGLKQLEDPTIPDPSSFQSWAEMKSATTELL